MIDNRLVTPLRVLMVLLFAGLLVAQCLMVPGQFHDMGEDGTPAAALRIPFIAFFIVEILCVQVVLGCTWRLLSMVKEGEIFSESAFRWVDGILWAIAVALVLWGCLGLFAGLVAYFGSDDGVAPGLVIAIGVVGLGGLVLFLLMLVMRALLRQATRLRTDMEGVI
ncbi:DUF2975 domain-containing protein [Zhihengliuella sp.]|uniref:DUF2975 domain-containing protein n=1 Tax=Zhihengliuella sp. TaxID=1954483 RepID=UPI002811AFCB|nr:DUF2975 domain-containing protein [Zhihengliuella sp.]